MISGLLRHPAAIDHLFCQGSRRLSRPLVSWRLFCTDEKPAQQAPSGRGVIPDKEGKCRPDLTGEELDQASQLTEEMRQAIEDMRPRWADEARQAIEHLEPRWNDEVRQVFEDMRPRWRDEFRQAMEDKKPRWFDEFLQVVEDRRRRSLTSDSESAPTSDSKSTPAPNSDPESTPTPA